ncbi:MAG: HAMP domain-containing protein [Bacteroides sp.]|nr:HAMP domain-containing protein [Bacteroides sp.]
MKKLSLQNRIAFNIIVCTLALTIVLCGIILLVFKVYTGRIESGAVITLTDVENLFTILLRVCAVGCFVVLMLLFSISRRIARNSIKPIREIINTAEVITHNNLSARIPLPNHTDELYELSETINHLLDRIEYAVERERNFTSYASHEFRTPLSILKGTMEVLIRKPRSEAEYKKRISICIKEVDRLKT